MASSKRWLFPVATLIIGLGVGSYLSFYYTSKFFMDAHYSSLVAEMTVDISALKSLRDGDASNAIELLDTRVDTAIITLDARDAPVSEKRKQAVRNIFRQADEYKKQYGVKSGSDDMSALVNESIARALSE